MTARTTRSIAALAVAAGFIATAGAQSTTRVSVDSGGGQANSRSYVHSMSSDGRLVAFSSLASNLVAADTNGAEDVFLHDRQTGITERISIATSGVQGNDASDEPSLSGDGKFIAFRSAATNLVVGDSNGVRDIFVRDIQAGATSRVSVSSSGSQLDDESDAPAMSSDGRFVSFMSIATNLTCGNGVWNVHVRDLQTSITEIVSAAIIPCSDSDSGRPSISADGRYIAFESHASDLVHGDSNGCYDVFVRDRQTAMTERISLDSSGAQANGASYEASISGDGRYIAFSSVATNLAPGDTNNASDVFLRDRQTGITRRVSVDTNSTQALGASDAPLLTADGHLVLFRSAASNLVAGDTNGAMDIFMRDYQSSVTIRICVDAAGAQGNGDAMMPTVCGDGRFAAFSSAASNLVPADSNNQVDAFVRDCTTPCFADGDLDGVGAGPAVLLGAPGSCGPGLSDSHEDCDDASASVYPGAPEICDGLDNDCDGVIDNSFTSTYCTAGTTVHGCVPSIIGIGAPSSSSGSGFDIVASYVEGQRMGLIFYGSYSAGVPWAPNSPSYRCVSYPTQRLPTQNSGGTLGHCDGELRTDFNAWIQVNPYGLGFPFVAGQVFYAQGWFRDSGAPKGTNLSDGLRFTLCN